MTILPGAGSKARKVAYAPHRNTLRATARRAGVLAPRSSDPVRFSLQGPGAIIATDNGYPISFESPQAPQRKAFNRRTVVIVRAGPGQTGPRVLRAESDGRAGRPGHLHEFIPRT